MPSLRKRVSTYLRQLSFHNEPRNGRRNINENTFVTKYLLGQIKLKEGPPIVYGKNATDLPNYELDEYEIGPNTISGCYTGPNGGLTTVKRIEKHLSIPDPDIDFIDTGNLHDDDNNVGDEKREIVLPKRSPLGQPVDNTTMIIKVGGQEYCVTNRTKKQQPQEQEQQQPEHHKSHSLGSLNDFDDVIIEKTIRIDPITKTIDNNPITKQIDDDDDSKNDDKKQNYGLAKSKSEGNPFRHQRGKIIKMTTRPTTDNGQHNRDSNQIVIDDSLLPNEWLKKSDFIYGISDSLYDRNQVTNHKNGDPIADCFGIISRNDSAILAVADGVNWGEKACIAAKSAIHGCLHYLNKTIFNDTKPFDKLTIKNDDNNHIDNDNDLIYNDTNFQRITNTKEIFICLLRAFNCAHDLILENNGMLTTLTVVVVLPLKRKPKQQQPESTTFPNNNSNSNNNNKQYICCVCNVGDTLAYVYSQKYGIRELTKGSHDINCIRDMRDALGALGPVDGINPELSNLTLSITTIQSGDIVMVASDGLTDNFDPNVCRFTVNQSDGSKDNSNRDSVKQRTTPPRLQPSQQQQSQENHKKAPIKPPRRSQPQSKQSTTTTSNSNSSSSSSQNSTQIEPNPLIDQFMKENAIDKPNIDTRSSYRRQISSQSYTESASSSSNKKPPPQQGYKFLRSKTTIDVKPRTLQSPIKPLIQRNDDGIPLITPIQRYELQLLLIEDILRNGINGIEQQSCRTAKQLCENLINFTFRITAAKRHTLEDPDLYYSNRNGLLIELTQQEKKQRRKKCLEKVQNLPGKLDHVSIVAWNVGNHSN